MEELFYDIFTKFGGDVKKQIIESLFRFGDCLTLVTIKQYNFAFLAPFISYEERGAGVVNAKFDRTAFACSEMMERILFEANNRFVEFIKEYAKKQEEEEHKLGEVYSFIVRFNSGKF